jgi:repressor LexA
MTAALTSRQSRILDFLREHVTAHGYPPTMREIADAVGLASPSSVQHQLARLAELGFIQRVPGNPRAIILTGGEPPVHLARADLRRLVSMAWPRTHEDDAFLDEVAKLARPAEGAGPLATVTELPGSGR